MNRVVRGQKNHAAKLHGCATHFEDFQLNFILFIFIMYVSSSHHMWLCISTVCYSEL